MPTFAAIDVGSNSVRLKIARLSGSRLRTCYEDREVTRLGEGVFTNGSLTPATMERTIAVLRRFRNATQRFGADRVRVVATSAVRDARNASVFRKLVRAATRWQLEVISGLEEGRLIHLGVLSGARVTAPVILLVDLGGGSCELTTSRDGHIEHMISLPLGAVRLTREFLLHDPPKSKELARMRQFITEEIGAAQPQFRGNRPMLVIATSGTAAALHDAWRAENGGRPRSVPAAAVLNLCEKLERLDERRRRSLPGIGPRRAEIIIAGAAVFAELMTRLNLRGFRYSPLGLRDGLLAQMAADYGHSQPMQTRIATERSDAILAMSRHYRIDVKHADRVRAAAEKLFVKLAAVHRLPSTYRHLIAAAAMLHEVGAFINRSGRYRHAYYVIANSDIFGFTPAERQIIAALARYAGKTKPEDSHAIVRAIRPSERPAFRVAVALLRLARSMDESRRGNIVDFTVRRRQAAVTLELTTRRSAELELWSVNKQRVFFRTVCGADLVATERSNRGTKTSAGR